jgi:hypothetical protein
MGKILELRAAVIEQLSTHRGQDAFWNRSGAGYLKKVPTKLLNRVLHRIALLKIR